MVETLLRWRPVLRVVCRRTRLVLLFVVVSVPSVASARAQTYEYFDISLALSEGETGLLSINEKGQVAGVLDPVPPSDKEGFIRHADGTIETFAPPNNTLGSLSVNGINASGATTGSFLDSTTRRQRGFLRTADGQFDVFDLPAPPSPLLQVLQPTALNDNNTVTGFMLDAATATVAAFIRSANGNFTSFNIPGSLIAPVPRGISNNGYVAGIFSNDVFNTRSFIRSPNGQIVTVDPPLSEIDGTIVWDIDSTGRTTGSFFVPSANISRGFIRSTSGSTTVFDVPGARITLSYAINDTGDTAGPVVPVYGKILADSSLETRGFIRSSDGEFTVFSVPDSGRTIPLAINKNGQVMGTFIDSQGALRGFLRSGLSADAGTAAHPFSVPDRGGRTLTSGGWSSLAQIGFARIEPAVGATTPLGIAIFGFAQNGIVVSEASVPSSAAVMSGRIHAEVDGPVNTGLALANGGNQIAVISYYFTDANGNDFGAGTLELAPGEQRASFLDQPPYTVQVPIHGTFTFSSTAPVSAVALRGLTNERSEFLITTLPVSPLAPIPGQTVFLPHFADGQGWTTQLMLVNPTDTTIAGRARFLSQGSGTIDAQPVGLTLTDNRSGSEFAYSIAPRSSVQMTTSGGSPVVQTGSVRVEPDTGSTSPIGVGVFALKSDGFTVSQAGVATHAAGTAFRMYAESSGTVRSGVAVTNTTSAVIGVNFELTDLNGIPVAAAASVALAPAGQTALFVDELFGSLPPGFTGVLRVTADSPVTLMGLRGRTNARGDFLMTTTPPANENDPAPTGDRFFPHFADGGGWITQFVLISGSEGPTSPGTIRFADQNGAALNLDVR